MRDVRVLYFQPHLTQVGGGSRFVLETAGALRQQGFHPVILAQSAKEDVLGAYEHDLEFRFIGGALPKNPLHWATLPLLIRKCEDIVRETRPDLLFLHVFPANWWGMIVKKRFPEIPIVWYCHDPNSFINDSAVIRGLGLPMRSVTVVSNPVARLTDQLLTRRTDKIIANSNFTAGRIRRIYKRDSVVIYPGVDTTRFRPSNTHRGGIFTTGLWTPSKRLDLLLDALRILEREEGWEGLRLRVAGPGRDIALMKERARRLGIEGRVDFLGPISEIALAREYSSALLVVYPSINEPFGLVPVEAMACGTPALVSSSGGTAETVVPGVTGGHFEDPNPASLARELRSLLGDEESLADMGRAARKRVVRNFTWERTAARLKEHLASAAKSIG